MTERAPASLVVRTLSHRYPAAERLALDRVAFEIEPGARVGLLGTNGAGKTTLMRLCCGSLAVQRGHDASAAIEVAGIDVSTRPLAARERLGYLPEQVPLHHELRVREHLGFRAGLKGVARRRRSAEIGRVAELVGLRDVLETPIFRLSRGYRQRVGIADALLGAPPLVVLDEPTVGLDPNQVQDVRAALRDLGGQHTLVLSSHVLAEVEALCDRVIILAEGRVAADETVEDAVSARSANVVWEGDAEAARRVLRSVLGESGAAPSIVPDGPHVRARGVPCPEGMETAAFLAAIGRESATAGLIVVRLEAGRRRLEERFSQVTASAAEGEAS